MSIADEIQIFGMADEKAAPETDPINAVNAKYWTPGHRMTPHGLPQEEHRWEPIYYDERDPGELVLIESIATASIGFTPTTAWPWYMFLGASSTVADPDNTHTITGINTGNLPTYTLRSESRGGSDDTFWSMVGSRVNALTFGVNFRNKTIPPVIGMAFLGIKVLIPNNMSFNTQHDGVQFPTDTGAMGATQSDDPYRVDASTVFNWDQGGTPDDYVDAILNFGYSGGNIFQPHYVQNQAEVEYLFEGKRTHNLVFEIRMGKDSSIWDHYYAKSKHDIRLKVFSSATNYLQLDFTDVAIGKPNPISEPHRDKRVYRIEAICKSVAVESLDGIKTTGGHTEFYGE